MVQSVEITPSTSEAGIASIASGLEVFLTHRPRDDLHTVMRQVKTVIRYGRRPVVHVPVHFFDHERTLHAWLMQLHDLGVQSVCVVRGDGARKGPFARSLDALRLPVLRRFRCWVVAHPLGMPGAQTKHLHRALQQKTPYAVGVLTQWCLDMGAIQAVIDSVTIPVRVGICPAIPCEEAMEWANRLQLDDIKHRLHTQGHRWLQSDGLMCERKQLRGLSGAEGGHAFAFG